MTNDRNIPMKQAEISLRRFNQEAIPHHLGLLKNHRSNIEKSLALSDWNKIRKEEINAVRVIKQVKNLLLEMDALREKICEEDLERFDASLKIGKDKAYAGMREYMELNLKPPLRSQSDDEQDENRRAGETVEIGTTMAHQRTLPQLQTNFKLEEHQLAQREACLEELEHLQGEIRELNGMFHNMCGLVHDQAEVVQAIAENADEALENVQQGEQHLRRALIYSKAVYPMVGALLGTCVGGPIGLMAGFKAAGLAAVGCGLLGFTGGSVLQINPTIMQGNIEEKQVIIDSHAQEDLELQKKTE